VRSAASLKRRLDALHDAFGPETLTPDPLEVVREYTSTADAEIAGVIASGLAFGNARTIVASARSALLPLGPSLAAELAERSDASLRRALRHFRHRWLDGDDVAACLASLRDVRKESGSLEAAFLAGDDGGPTVRGALSAFAARLRDADPGFGRRGASGFVPSPEAGSACKRPLLFLRWMVRPGPVDLGAWRSVSPSRLLLPLDVHTARITRSLGLLRRRATDWRAAEEVTEALRRLHPADPVRYDFALCRLGILRRSETSI
jgi:uncharacterized protein (TIGR02757 family)